MAWNKRNTIVLVIGIVLVAAVVLTALLPEPEDAYTFANREAATQELATEWIGVDEYNRYELALDFDPVGKTLAGTMDFTYRNDEDRPMGELRFLLYPNSFGSPAYGVFSENFDRAYPNGFSPGGIEIGAVAAQDDKKGQPLDWAVTGEQRHVLQVRLPESLPVGGEVSLSIEYVVTIPNCLGRFGYGENTFSLVNCHPILSVFESGVWHDYPYYEIGDPFYSEVADYRATIAAPTDYTIAATGLLAQNPDGIWTVDAPARRDFGFVASDRFRVESTEIGDTLVRSYYLEGSTDGGRQALATGAQSLELFNELFGPYPYSEFAVVQTDFFIGGMEYPGMVLIDSTCYDGMANRPVLDLIVAHETAHQWWYGTVGGDEVMEPWLDEGLTEFSTQLFFKKLRGKGYSKIYDIQIGYLTNYRLEDDETDDDRADQPSYTYDNSTSYSAWVYDRAAAVLMELRKEVGEEKLLGALQDYYKQNRLGVATRADLEAALEAGTGRELTDWLTERLGQPN